jgi:hypothetical protein
LVLALALADLPDRALGACQIIRGLVCGGNASPILFAALCSLGLAGGLVPEVGQVRLGDVAVRLGLNRA